jgi:division/cell wall cluster transcriptional repressor MraZ
VISPKNAKTGENPTGTELGGGGGVGSGGQSGAWVSRVAPAAEEEEICYLGEFKHGTDDKKRLQVPAKWRPTNMKNYELTVVLWTRGSEAESCLLVFPPSEIKKLLKSVKKLSWGDPQAETLRRALGGKSETVKFDQVGRICIPDRIAKPAGIEKNSEAMMVGLMDVFQIWNLKRFEAINSVDGVTLPQALARLKPEENKPE